MKNAIVIALIASLQMVSGGVLFAAQNSPVGDVPSLQTIELFEDFETPSDWNGANPPSGWSIVDSGAADGIWDIYDWYDTAGWGGQVARVSGSDRFRYNNDWLISPAADFSTASACTLFFRHYYDDYVTQTSDSALVILSSDNGSTWAETVAVYAGTDYGTVAVPDSEYFDISGFAAGRGSVRAAFQYVKRGSAATAGSWRVDDFKFRADGASILTQGFDSGWGPYGDNPPAGWSIVDVQVAKWDDNDWHQRFITNWGNVARVHWAPIESQNELLKSPVMNLMADTNAITLTLKQWYSHEVGTGDTAFILLSTDAGVTWPRTLCTYTGPDHGSLSSPAHDTVEIADWARRQANVMLGFKYVGNNNGKWYIDSVKVEASNRFARDAAVTAILAPSDTTIQGYVSAVSAQVENPGVNPATFSVVFLIADSTGATVYASIRNVVNLQPLQQTYVTFDTWIPAEPNDHSFACYSLLFMDLNRANDTVRTSTLTFPHAGTGGPVQGWSYKDNITGAGSPFDWIDISGYGPAINFSDLDDANSGMIDMGMSFKFFGFEYSRIAVCTNGWLSFEDSVSTDNSRSAIPDADGPSAMVALLWDDLHLRTGRVHYYHNTALNQFIVQYNSVEYASTPGSDISMEIIFDGNDNTIKMQYLLFAAGSRSDVTIGIENRAQDSGLAFNNNGEIGQTPIPGLAISYLYLLPDDIKALVIASPQVLVFGDTTYEIVAKLRNNGANVASFDVTAVDDHGYSNTQSVTDLGSLDTTIVAFPNWPIGAECENYELTVYSQLEGDLDKSNDTINTFYFASPPANIEYSFDQGTVFTTLTSDDTTDVLATEFDVLYSGATISAISYKCLNDDEISNRGGDTVRAYIFLDEDADGTPDANAVYSKRIVVPKSGWTTWEIGCDTTITIDCRHFWVGWSVTNTLQRAALAVDRRLDYPARKWARLLGTWDLLLYPYFYGDYMIKAYFEGDPATLPDVALGAAQLSGVALPSEVDTASTYIQNIGSGCDLEYTVTVLQSYNPATTVLSRKPEPVNETEGMAGSHVMNVREAAPEKESRPDEPPGPPQLLDSGGPDIYGYTWKDSDEPGGPGYYWINIVDAGTEVVWSHGTGDDGWTNLIPMGMVFSFYGSIFNSVVISTNGWVSFVPQTSSYLVGSPIPSPEDPNALLAVEWDDLDAGAVGHCYYYHDVAGNAFTIAWINWSHYPSPATLHDFEVTFNGTDGTIRCQYRTGTFPTGMSVGIESWTGNDGLQIALNQAYLHPGLAILIEPPTFWLSTDLVSGTLPPMGSELPFNVFMNAAGLPAGGQDGAIVINSNDPDEPVAVLPVHFEIEAPCAYLPGDVNGSGHADGIDVQFMVNYFKGGPPPHEDCPPCSLIDRSMLYPQGDVNATCVWNGIDVTYFVNYLKGMGEPLKFCDQCPPAGGRLMLPGSIDKPTPKSPGTLKAAGNIAR